MLRHPVVFFAALLVSLVGVCPVALAQRAETEPGANVQVSAVRFRQARVDGQQFPWLEAEIELQSRGRDARAPGNPRFVDGLRIELMIAFEQRGEGNRGFSYYRSSQTAVSLDTGRSVVRFYLPWEIIRRDSLSASSEPNFWLVNLHAGDQELAPSNRASATRFESPQMVQNFRQRVGAEGAVNDGILVPQYDSPFSLTNLKDVPTMVRKPVR